MRSSSQLRPVRHWFMPSPHTMLSLFTPQQAAQPAATFSCRVATPHLAYLWQHGVNGRALLPGAAMFEAAFAAASVLAAGDEEGCRDRLALAGSSITSPCLLPHSASGTRVVQDKPLALTCAIQQGKVSLGSDSGYAAHLRGYIALLGAPRSSRACSTSLTANAAPHSRAYVLSPMLASSAQAQDSSPSGAAFGCMDIQVRSTFHLMCCLRVLSNVLPRCVCFIMPGEGYLLQAVSSMTALKYLIWPCSPASGIYTVHLHV